MCVWGLLLLLGAAGVAGTEHPNAICTGTCICKPGYYKSATPDPPMNFLTLDMWFDATDLSGNIRTWPDKSGNGRNADAIDQMPRASTDGMLQFSNSPMTVVNHPAYHPESSNFFTAVVFRKDLDDAINYVMGHATSSCVQTGIVSEDIVYHGLFVGINAFYASSPGDWIYFSNGVEPDVVSTVQLHCADGSCESTLDSDGSRRTKTAEGNSECTLSSTDFIIGGRRSSQNTGTSFELEGAIGEILTGPSLTPVQRVLLDHYLFMRWEDRKAIWCYACAGPACSAGSYRPKCNGTTSSLPTCQPCTPVVNGYSSGLTCTTSTNSKIVSCFPGYYKGTVTIDAPDVCLRCDTGCAECTGSGVCQRCEPDYGLSEGMCSRCEGNSRWVSSTAPCEPCGDFVANCVSCSSTACSVCEDQYGLVAGLTCASCVSTEFYNNSTSPCLPCSYGLPGECEDPVFSLTCNSTGHGLTCATCPSGTYDHSSGTCEDCVPNLLCSGGLRCTGPGEGEACGDGCLSGTYSRAGVCSTCDTNPLCSGGLECLGSGGVGEVCGDGCVAGAFVTGGVCTACTPNPRCVAGLECTGPDGQGEQCGECSVGFSLTGNTCVETTCFNHTCPPPFLMDDPTVVCEGVCTDEKCCSEPPCPGPPAVFVENSPNRHFVCTERAPGAVCLLACQPRFQATKSFTCSLGAWNTDVACFEANGTCASFTCPGNLVPVTPLLLECRGLPCTVAECCVAPEGSEVVVSENGEGSTSSSSPAIIIGAVGVAVACMCCVLVGAVIVLHSRSPKRSASAYINKDDDATVKIDKDSFGNSLQAKIDATKPFAVGGFGAVYQITLDDGKVVALKVLDGAASEKEKGEFHRESNILAKLSLLNSPYIVPVACFCDAPMCIGMEFASNGTLMNKVKSHPASGADLVSLCLDTCLPLAFLHEKGFAHLDVKPQNYLIMDDDRIVICDFGLTTEIDAVDEGTGTGTLHYIAPERYIGTPGVDMRMCDVYSWSIMLTVFATGELPFKQFQASNIPSLMAEKGMRPPFPEGTPGLVREIAEQCWQHEPSDRYTMAHVSKMLRDQDGDATVAIPSMKNDSAPMSSSALSALSDGNTNSRTSMIQTDERY